MMPQGRRILQRSGEEAKGDCRFTHASKSSRRGVRLRTDPGDGSHRNREVNVALHVEESHAVAQQLRERNVAPLVEVLTQRGEAVAEEDKVGAFGPTFDRVESVPTGGE